LLDTQIALVHSQANSAKGIGFAIGNALGHASDVWSSALWVAGDFTYGTPVDVSAANFVGEWLEFELNWPDGRKELTRRAIATRATAEWRERRPLDVATLQPLPRNDHGALAMQAVHNIWFSAGRHNLAQFTQAMQRLAERNFLRTASPNAADDPVLAEQGFGDGIWAMALQNFTWMLWSDHVVIPMLNDTPGLKLYADAPRIAIFTEGPGADENLLGICDLRRDHLRGLAIDDSKRLALAERKLRFWLASGRAGTGGDL
jgi:hypothetical protein